MNGPAEVRNPERLHTQAGGRVLVYLLQYSDRDLIGRGKHFSHSFLTVSKNPYFLCASASVVGRLVQSSELMTVYIHL